MEDFILDVKVTVTKKYVTPKTGLTQRGPLERNRSLVIEKASKYFYGTDAQIATAAQNAVKVLTQQWGLLTTQPAEGYPTPATPIAATTATINGKVHDHGTSTVVTFEFGTTKALGTSTAAAQSPLTGDALQTVSLAKTGLTASTQYYYRLKMVSGGVTVYSQVATFVTSV